MKNIPVSAQLYSLREEAKKLGYIEVLKKVAGYGYPAVEFAGLFGEKPGEIRKVLDGLGLKVSSAHGAVPTKENAAEIGDAAGALGYKWHVSGFGPKQFATEDDCKKTAEQFQAGALALKKEGLKFAVHNHYWEFDHKFNGKYPHEIMMELAPDVYAQIDTYWTAVGGANAAETVRKNARRAPLLHIKDGPLDKNLPMTAVGAGKMEWKPVLEAVDEKTIEWLIVELDCCATDMFEAVHKSLRYLVDNGFGCER